MGTCVSSTSLFFSQYISNLNSEHETRVTYPEVIPRAARCSLHRLPDELTHTGGVTVRVHAVNEVRTQHHMSSILALELVEASQLVRCTISNDKQSPRNSQTIQLTIRTACEET